MGSAPFRWSFVWVGWLVFVTLWWPLDGSSSGSSRLTAIEKKKLCARDFARYAKPFGLVQVTPTVNPNALPPSYPRVLCFMYTISPWHATRAQAVVDTWGQRCHKLVVFSNDTYDFAPSNVNLIQLRQQQEHNHAKLIVSSGLSTNMTNTTVDGMTNGTDIDSMDSVLPVKQLIPKSIAHKPADTIASTKTNSTFEVVVLNVPADYSHLWQRHRTAVRYVYDHFRDDFDWFYKADDDTYVIMENLIEYLKRPEITMNVLLKPIQLGHRFKMEDSTVKFYTDRMSFSDQYYQRFDRWVFNSGGPGYAINGLYLDRLVAALKDKTCFSDQQSQTVPEDSATAFCMMWHGVYPWDTRDLKGRERWHAFNPSDTYYTRNDDSAYWYVAYHESIGGVHPGDDCCAPDSIAYHYMTPTSMYHAERQFYFCRSDELDLDVFNQKYKLAISNKILLAPE